MDPDAVLDAERVPHGSSDDPDLLDFSANVNPELPPGTREVYESVLDLSRTYPTDDYPKFRRTAADYSACDPEQVVPTPGGLAAIRLAVEVTVAPGDTVLVPYPSFGEYAREVRLQGAEPAFVQHDELLDADPSEHALAVVCNPNNPTGGVYCPDALRAFADHCREAGTVLLADEAFLGFTDNPTLAGRKGVVVARSLTKLFGLPGLRVGFAVAGGGTGGATHGSTPDMASGEIASLVDRLNRARKAWALGTPAAVVGAHAMNQCEFVRETSERVARERARMRERLARRFEVSPSDAPFLLLEVDGDVRALVERCRERGVAIRDATTFQGLDSHVRVAVRLPDENDRLLEALDV